MNDRPVWLLDVDGVLNAVTRKPDRNVWPSDQWINGHVEARGRRFSITWSRPVVEFVRLMHDSGRADIRWHTTWQDDAAAIADLVGLPEFPIHDAPEFQSLRNAWWKVPGALRVVEEERRPLVWTDDDAGNRWDLPQSDRDRLIAAAPTLIVAPSPQTGLTPKHLRQIGEFLDTTQRGTR